MASKLNTEFNYRYQVIGDTPWERIKTLKGGGLKPKGTKILEGNINPQLKIELKGVEDEVI